ncbi:MAG: hypothetical protein ABII09_03395 [Planctomycetota bacterium]
MWKRFPGFVSPKNANSKIWKNMDFTKFVSLHEKKTLYLSRIDKLGDPFEGSTTIVNKLFIRMVNSENIKRLRKQGASEEQISDMENLFKKVEKKGDELEILKELRKDIYVSCWHLSEHESAAMWNLYLKSNEGIAIQSTYKRFKNCFNNKIAEVYIGQVRYMDYHAEFLRPGYGYGYYMHKRKSFEHENELRALVAKHELSESLGGKPRTGDGIYVSVNINTLLEKVVVSPESPMWVANLVKDVVKRYGLRKRVEISSLNERPLF